MAQRIQVNGTFKTFGIIGSWIIAGFSAIVAVVFYLVKFKSGAVVMSGATLVLGLVGAIKYQQAARSRRWLVPLPDGCIVHNGVRSRKYRDEHLTSIGLQVSRIFNNEGVASFQRKGQLVFDAGNRPEIVPLDYTFPLSGDPLGKLFERLVKARTDKAREEILNGVPLTGEDWSLDRDVFNLDRGDASLTLRRAEIAAAYYVDDDLCIYRRGKARPIVRLKASLPNVIVLGTLLQEAIDGRGPEKAWGPGDGLGRLLFERSGSMPAPVVAFWVFGVIAGLVGLGNLLGLVTDPKKNTPVEWLFAGLLVVAGVALCGLGVAYRHRSFACHERGVRKSDFYGLVSLRYDQVGEFTYSATRIYINGTYSGVTVEMTFKPRPGVKSGVIQYCSPQSNQNDELDKLRDHIAQVIASHMLKDLQAGREVRWGQVTFYQDGLRHRPKNFSGQPQDLKLIPYAEISGINFNQGVFFVFTNFGKTATLSMPVSTPNFFPGFELLGWLVNNPGLARGETTASAPAAETPPTWTTRKADL